MIDKTQPVEIISVVINDNEKRDNRVHGKPDRFKYTREYMSERMDDFEDFRHALQDLEYSFSTTDEIILYSIFRHGR